MAPLQLVSNTESAPSADDLVSDFCQNCGFRRLPWMRAEFSSFLARGFDPLLIREAINRTARAPRPSWAYLNAIMNNCARCGVFDIATFLLSQRKQREAPEELPY